MPQAGFEPGSSAATLLEFEQRLKPLGHHGRFSSQLNYIQNSCNTEHCKRFNLRCFKKRINCFVRASNQDHRMVKNESTPILSAFYYLVHLW